MGVPATIISPHLDDAVLSCWHVLAGSGDVRVVNVFTGTPPDPRAERYYWDRITGAEDSAVRMRERIEEDREALGLVGVEPVNLGLLDSQYREDPLPPAGVGERIRAALTPGTTVYAPVAFSYHGEYGQHPDHQAARDVGRELVSEGFDVRLYLDLPFGLQRGRPAWVPGGSDGGAPDWDGWLARAGFDPAGLSPQVHALSPDQFEQKLAAARAYRTQLPELERLADLDDLRNEVVWSVAAGSLRTTNEEREAVER